MWPLSVAAFQFWSNEGLQWGIVTDGKAKKDKSIGKEDSIELEDIQNVAIQRETFFLQMLRLFNSPVGTEGSFCAQKQKQNHRSNVFNMLSTLPRVSFSQTLFEPLVQVSRTGRALFFFFFGGLASIFTEGCYLNTNGHCYHQFSTAFVWVNMWQEGGAYRCEKGKKHCKRNTYKPTSRKLFRSFSYPKLLYFSRLIQASSSWRNQLFLWATHSKKT